jgi:hypothetical protein
VNRRISIVVMSHKAAEAATWEGGTTMDIKSDAGTVNAKALEPSEAG